MIHRCERDNWSYGVWERCPNSATARDGLVWVCESHNANPYTYRSLSAQLLAEYADDHPENVVWDSENGWRDER